MNGAEFADAAVRLAGLAGVLFGWRPSEFWDATPAELSAVAAAMTGESGALGTDDLERLQRMLVESPDG